MWQWQCCGQRCLPSLVSYVSPGRDFSDCSAFVSAEKHLDIKPQHELERERQLELQRLGLFPSPAHCWPLLAGRQLPHCRPQVVRRHRARAPAGTGDVLPPPHPCLQAVIMMASSTQLTLILSSFSQALTMDFRPNRVNVAVDANGRITRVHHG